MGLRQVVGLVVMLALVGAGCSGEQEAPEQEPQVRSVAAGDCLAIGEGSRGLTPTMVATGNEVECTEPHALQVVAVEDFPEELSNDATATMTFRDDLVGVVEAPSDARERDISAWVKQTCSAGIAREAGLDRVSLEGQRGARDVAMLPADRISTIGYEFPEESWTERPRVVCAVIFTDQVSLDEPADSRRSANVEGRPLRDYLTPEFAVEHRSCYRTDEAGQVSDGDCARPHYVELFFAFDADAVLDPDLLTRIEADPNALPDDVYDELDAVCSQALEDVVGDGFDDEALRGYAQLYTGWTSPAWFRWIQCGVVPTDPASDLPGGSVVGIGDETVELVPVRTPTTG